MVIVGLGGSTGPASTTDALLVRCLELAAERGATTRLFHGDDLARMPIYSATDAPEAAPMVEAVRVASGVVIATPGYHGGMSGLVKNALDHLEALRNDPHPYLDGRAVGAIVSAAGWQAAGSTLLAVRSTIHALRGWPTPFGVTVNSAEQSPDDPGVEGALAILAGQLVDFGTWRARAAERDAATGRRS